MLWLNRSGFTWIRKRKRRKETSQDTHFNQLEKAHLSICISGVTDHLKRESTIKASSWELDTKLWEMCVRSQGSFVKCVVILHHYLMKVSLGITSQIQILLVLHAVWSPAIWDGDWTESWWCVCVLPHCPKHKCITPIALRLHSLLFGPMASTELKFSFYFCTKSHIPTEYTVKIMFSLILLLKPTMRLIAIQSLYF